MKREKAKYLTCNFYIDNIKIKILGYIELNKVHY